jgi:glycine oxidase
LDLKHLTREDVFFQQLGSLMVAHRSDQGAAQRVLARLMQAPQSQQPRPLSTAESRSLEPALAPGLNVWFLPQEGQILPRQILSALYTASQNVQWHWNATVFDVAPHALTLSHQEIKQFDVVIDARGVGAKPQMPKIRGVRGELIWLHVPQVQLQRPIRLLHPRHRVYLTPRPDDIIVVGASEIESEDRSPVSLRSAVELMVAAQSVIPELAEARIVHLETNLRPALPDNHPHVHVEQGLIRVNGLFRHGWLVAPALAETVIDHCNRLTSSGAAIPEFEI